MDPERIEREEPAGPRNSRRRHGPVQGEGAWKRLLPAIVNDITAAPQLTTRSCADIRLPVLLVYGDRDVFVPVDHAVSIYRHMPDARLLDRAEQPAHGDGRPARAVQPGRG